MKEKFNAKNISLFCGLLGFVALFIIFGFTCCSLGKQDYSLYSLFFMITDDLLPMGGPIFFIVFMINFLLYISLLVIRLSGKDSVKTAFLGVVGIIINALNMVALLALIFSFDDISDLILTIIALELIGFFVMYTAWIYACKNRKTEGNGCINTKKYALFSILELLFFLLPLAIFIGFLLLIGGGTFRNGKATTQFKFNKDDNTITVNNVKYLVKDNKIFDIKTNKEVGHLEKDKAIFDIKTN